MEETAIEVLPKKSVKAFRYLGTFIFFVVGLFIIWDGNDFDLPFLQVLTTIIGGGTVLASILWIPHTYKFKIDFGPHSIKQSGLLSKEIAYKNIEKLVVRKGFIEICGEGFFKRISIGDLYNNFNTATETLASKIKEGDHIKFAGQKKYIEQYFKSPTA